MRKPRDYDAELKVLSDQAKLLRDRKLVQLGELAVATGADALPVDMLAGVLLAAVATNDAGAKEAWRKRGAVFFQRSARHAAGSDGHGIGSGEASSSGAKPPIADAGAS